jgi:hypothetical protein
MRSKLFTGTVLMAAFLLPNPVQAGAMTKGVRELMEYVGKKFGREVAEEGTERVTGRLMRLAGKHGEEIVGKAFRKVGPRAGRIVEEAGDEGGLALRLLARHGEEAIPLIGRSTALRTVARYGDDAAAAIIKHGVVGEQLVGTFAKEGAEALIKVTPRNGRRLAMMAAQGELKPELMQVISRFGDRACDFIWRNKGALAVGAALTAFLKSPEPFINGTEKLTGTIADAAVKPIAVGVANNTNWTLIVVMVIAILTIAGCLRAVMSGKLSLWRAHSAKQGSDSNVLHSDGK